MNLRPRRFAALLAVVSLLGGIALFSPRLQVSAEGLPKQLSDRAFWEMIVDFSEPSGSFRSDNLVSNERTFQFVLPQLKEETAPGGVYVGVGPDQNFTYISALEPRMAFIVDIRRQNMLLHLMYKALIEMSDDRPEFLSRLFSRARPSHLDRKAAAEVLFEAYDGVQSSETLFKKNLRTIDDRLVRHHDFALSDEDLQGIESVYHAFFIGGPDLRYSFAQQQGVVRFPSYADLMLATDGMGHNLSYLATDESYRALREIEKKNLLVPLVGDFGGDKAIRRVGQYVREHGATVAVFYTSNVEQYLFQTDAWMRFYHNVATLPIDSGSTFIRSYFNLGFRSPQDFALTPQSDMLLDPIESLLNAFRSGQVRTYYDVVQHSR
jgi:hypothetical protein